jgi:hypothetical protein
MRCRTRNVLARCAAIGLAVMLATPSPPRAQPSGGENRPFKPEELEQIVAPIALYPDPLVAQIFMASTYPLEVIQAARFAKANPNLKDAALNEELKKQTWDDSVKALVSFPQVLEMMDSQLEWMQKVGDAVLAQQKETMDAIQRLRAKAQTAGNLKSTEQQKVIVEEVAPPQQQTIIRIEPASPEVIYVPTYNPTVVYGAWRTRPILPITTTRPTTLSATSRLRPRSRSAWGCWSAAQSGAGATGVAATSTST